MNKFFGVLQDALQEKGITLKTTTANEHAP